MVISGLQIWYTFKCDDGNFAIFRTGGSYES